jgi:hypothetical protein
MTSEIFSVAPTGQRLGVSVMAKKRRDRGFRGAGSIDLQPSGRWRLRVPVEGGGRATYGHFVTEELAVEAQARWLLTHLLADDDPAQAVEVPASVPVGGVRCDEWFGQWQDAKKARRSLVRVNKKRGGAESTAARDRAYWSKWWEPPLGSMLPHMVTQRDITAVIDAMEAAGLAPLTIKTHWSIVKAFFDWLAEEAVLTVSPIAKGSVSADAVLDRVREIVVPDFRFIEMLSDRLGAGQDRLVFELLLGTAGTGWFMTLEALKSATGLSALSTPTLAQLPRRLGWQSGQGVT